MDNRTTPTPRDIERAAADSRIILGSFDPADLDSWYGIERLAYSYHDLTRVPHLLVMGRTGAGKSILLRNYLNVAALAPESYTIVHITTDADMGFSEDIDQVKNVPLQDAEHKLAQVVEKALPSREKKLRDANVSNWDELIRTGEDGEDTPRRLLVLVDGVERTLGGDMLSRNKVTKYLAEILRRGRGLGVHLVVTTQAETPEKMYRMPDVVQEFTHKVMFSYRHRGSGYAVWCEGKEVMSPEFAVNAPGLD